MFKQIGHYSFQEESTKVLLEFEKDFIRLSKATSFVVAFKDSEVKEIYQILKQLNLDFEMMNLVLEWYEEDSVDFLHTIRETYDTRLM